MRAEPGWNWPEIDGTGCASLEGVVARLAGGFLEAIGRDALQDAVRVALTKPLGELDEIKALPGMTRAGDSRRRQGEGRREAIVGGTCDRLRAVVLTSATTIGGLTPLMFETSLQAQFLVPMALTIVVGLAFATVLILLVVPALIAVLHDSGAFRRMLSGRGAKRGTNSNEVGSSCRSLEKAPLLTMVAGSRFDPQHADGALPANFLSSLELSAS